MAAKPLEIFNVTKRYGNFVAVRDLSLDLAAGSICGFLGPNGAGKTTTIRMILDILKPTEGTIRVLGNSSALEARDRIGYLPEEKGSFHQREPSLHEVFVRLVGTNEEAR